MRSRQIHSHIRANVIGYVALFFSLSLGTAWALEANSVRSKHIVNGQVKGKDTKRSQVQARVDENCAAGRSIRAIAEDGTVTCETVGGGGSPTGPAGGDLSGSSYPNPLIANGAVNSAKVANNSLTGDDVNESQLGQVPSALLGGFGRTGTQGGLCDPESTTFLNCALTGVINVPAGGARALVLGRVFASPEEDSALMRGECRLGTSTVGPVPNTTTWIAQNDDAWEDVTVIGVSPPLPAGPTNFGIDCNQQVPGTIDYNRASATAVLISPN